MKPMPITPLSAFAHPMSASEEPSTRRWTAYEEATTEKREEQIVRNCMRDRGYSILD